MKRFIILLISVFLLILPIIAQEDFDAPRESGRAYVLSTADGIVRIAQFNQDFSGTIDIDYHPQDPRRWARVDNFGIIRFTDFGNPTIAEGVYTFAPYVENFQVATPQENKIFAREIVWSPDGNMIAFRIQNDTSPDLNQGVWFWQPLREIDTDPSYQILRHCPPFCTAVGAAEGDPGWRALDLEWSSDNNAILITLHLFDTNRRGLEIRQAARDHDQIQAGTRPNPLLFEYGHWADDGQRIIVSGRDTDGTVVFGTTDRTGDVALMTPASDIGMAWVQDAVQTPENSIIMLGNTVGLGAPLQIINQSGEQLTAPIGDTAFDIVKWSPDRRAVLLQSAEQTFIAQVDGTIYNITDLLVNNSPNIDWIDSAIPSDFTLLTMPQPLVTGETIADTTPEPITDNETYMIGDLLVLDAGTLDIYSDPVGDSSIVGTLIPSEELIITGGPLQDADATWYRVQSLNFTGWIRNIDNLRHGQ
ncbi:MAG: hypothetical protein Q9P44_06945 [Anaerolineae bacterium]|nr:hypothetical protein [Anaerolineae bacterium]